MNPPVDGCARENWASVLPSSATAITAAMIVSGAATPAVNTRNPNPKKKLYAGPMLAIVEAEMSTRPSAPRFSRSAGWGTLVSENGTEAASLMCSPLVQPGRLPRAREAAAYGSRSGSLLRSEEHTSELQSHVNLVC